MASVEISSIEVLALKKLALICGATGIGLKDHGTSREQLALTRVLIDVVNRAEAALASHQTKEEANV